MDLPAILLALPTAEEYPASLRTATNPRLRLDLHPVVEVARRRRVLLSVSH
jgi:hypothetical protein